MVGIVIIGAGECGVRAAFSLREQGYEGDVTLIGDEASLPYERPPLSKGGQLMVKPIHEASAYEAASIQLRCGRRATGIDPSIRLVQLESGEGVAYEQLLMATGARARLFDGMEGCLTLRTDAEANAILAKFQPGAHIGIIGGGFIGLELAATGRCCRDRPLTDIEVAYPIQDALDAAQIQRQSS